MAIGCSSAQQPTKNRNEGKEIISAYVAKIPDSFEFCGEKVPLEYADVRESFSRALQLTMYMHTTTLQTLSRTTRYFPIIEPILKEMGIPNDFKYLAMTESRLDPTAASGAGARGMWQFVASAAKDFRLETGDNVDMRYNVEKSTRAACKYIKRAYEKYGSWTMAAASYNVGMAGLSSRLSKQKIENYYDAHLPEETMKYLFHIMAYKLVTPNPEKYGFLLKPEDYYPAYKNIKTIEVNNATIDWPKLAESHGTNYKILRILNPWIRSYSYQNTSQKKYTVTLPTGDFRKLGY